MDRLMTRPDEKGIKTFGPAHFTLPLGLMTRPDEKGIKTAAQDGVAQDGAVDDETR